MIDIKYVAQGISATDYFDYNGSPLPYRPLTTWELDDAFEKSIVSLSDQHVRLIMKMKLGELKQSDMVKCTTGDYIALNRQSNELDYWIVYHGIKDFQDVNFKKPADTGEPQGYLLVKNTFQHVHDIANKVFTASKQPEAAVTEFVKTPEGRILASIHYKLHVPLSSDLWRLTPLQIDFLIKANSEINIVAKSDNSHFHTVSSKPTFKSGMSLADFNKAMGELRRENVNNDSRPGSGN